MRDHVGAGSVAARAAPARAARAPAGPPWRRRATAAGPRPPRTRSKPLEIAA
jgi:hypothetical protein